tara:strand:+ start:841 stop:1641 length:801 start_codon:yes stop_codon:yes gene_type:complete
MADAKNAPKANEPKADEDKAPAAAKGEPDHKHEPSFAEAVQAEVKAYLDANLEELVKAAMPREIDVGTLVIGADADLPADLVERFKALIPETPAQVAERQRLTQEEAIEKGRSRAARTAKRQAREQEKAAKAAAEERAELEEKAAKAFAETPPFIGDVRDITGKIIRAVVVDNGQAYSPDHRIEVRESELEPTADGGLLLTKAIELPAKSREFAVVGVSLMTDAGALRTVLNGRRKCGGGHSISFPARTLVFRPAPPKAVAEADAA